MTLRRRAALGGVRCVVLGRAHAAPETAWHDWSRQMRRATWISTALTLLLAAAAWWVLAPPQLGGSTSYVVVYGISMEPKLNRDDLVLVRHRSEYHVGDVVLYRSADLGRSVLHRIIRRDGSRFVLKGDNNNFIDSSRPAQQDVVGELWLRVPGGGKVLGWIRQPRNAAVLAGLAALLTGSGAGVRASRRQRRRGERSPRPKLPSLTVPRIAISREALQALAACGVIVLLMGILAALAFTRPTTRTVAGAPIYTQTGQFAYSADVTPSPVYPNGKVRTGDSVFLKLVPAVAVRFDYRVEAGKPHAFAGTARLRARLSDGAGWTSELLLQPSKTFEGDRVSVSGTLPLDRLTAMTRRFEELTGSHVDVYKLAVIPEIDLRGIAASRRIHSVFSPELVLQLDTPVRMGLPGSADPAGNSLMRSKATPGTEVVGNEIRLLGAHIGVRTARRVSTIGGAIALSGVVAIGFLLMAAFGASDGPARIQARYGSWLVPIDPPTERAVSPIDVASFEGLFRLAERYERMILHERVDGEHSYLVEDDGRVYRYRIPASVAESKASAEPPDGPSRLPSVASLPLRRETGPEPHDDGT